MSRTEMAAVWPPNAAVAPVQVSAEQDLISLQRAGRRVCFI